MNTFASTITLTIMCIRGAGLLCRCWVGCGRNNRRVGACVDRLPAGSNDLLIKNVQMDPGDHLASYSVGTGTNFPGGKAAVARR
jgi:hypothetical protein